MQSGQIACQHLVQHTAEGPDVRAAILPMGLREPPATPITFFKGQDAINGTQFLYAAVQMRFSCLPGSPLRSSASPLASSSSSTPGRCSAFSLQSSRSFSLSSSPTSLPTAPVSLRTWQLPVFSSPLPTASTVTATGPPLRASHSAQSLPDSLT